MAESASSHFDNLCEKLTTFDGVKIGNMMRSPGLKYNDKVFAFFHKDTMVFRLGPDFDPKKWGIKNPKPLSPFKTKPPLKGWFVIDHSEVDFWEQLTEMALAYTQTLK